MSNILIIVILLPLQLVGLALFAAGIVIKFASQYVQPYIDQLTAGIPNIAASASVASPNSASGEFIFLYFCCKNLLLGIICSVTMLYYNRTNKPIYMPHTLN